MSESGSRRSFIGTTGAAAWSLQPSRAAAEDGVEDAPGDAAHLYERPS
jgi:hypothetical protein